MYGLYGLSLYGLSALPNNLSSKKNYFQAKIRHLFERFKSNYMKFIQ